MDLEKLEGLAEPIFEFIKQLDLPYVKIEIDKEGIKVYNAEAFIPVAII